MGHLLEETLDILQDYGKTIEDVKWIGTNEYIIPIEQFIKIADRMYNGGYGIEEVDTGLVVVGEDWWLARAEYDGSEWWEFRKIPTKPAMLVENPIIFRNQ